MKKVHHLDDTSQLHSDSPALMLVSVGALIGAVASLVIMRSNRIKAAFRHAQPHSRPYEEGESSDRKIASLETASIGR